MLMLAKDADLCTKEFKVDELTRHFASALAEATKAFAAADHNKPLDKLARSPAATTASPAKKDPAADGQLNLFEFTAFLVRVAFWRANPQWGSKSNKKELTPVPDSMQILLDECILPKAKRDTSGELQKVVSMYEAHGLSPYSLSFLSKVLAGVVAA
mmetsp:Transcript_77746/g.154461  ORF Transcript_77746/g.154461 Transcript_77746/m.154461 type:complete len:157 (-) Transcript_77746:239-709(-)